MFSTLKRAPIVSTAPEVNARSTTRLRDSPGLRTTGRSSARPAAGWRATVACEAVPVP
ncbi:MAG: hypothetical protein Q4615_04200 [Paracoccus aminovorans]|nr:hypothetical protein [Paracoccus aminovorans]